MAAAGAEIERCACGWLLPKQWDIFGPLDERVVDRSDELIVVLACPSCGAEHEAKATARELPRA